MRYVPHENNNYATPIIDNTTTRAESDVNTLETRRHARWQSATWQNVKTSHAGVIRECLNASTWTRNQRRWYVCRKMQRKVEFLASCATRRRCRYDDDWMNWRWVILLRATKSMVGAMDTFPLGNAYRPFSVVLYRVFIRCYTARITSYVIWQI